MWYEYNDNVGVTRYIFSFVPEYMDKYVVIAINGENLDCSMVVMDGIKHGVWVTEDMVWFLKFDYIENAECAIGNVPEVLREYVESGFFEIDKRRVMSNRKLLLGSCYGDL